MHDLPPVREHHFYVSIAKFVFHHPEHGIVSVADPIRLADAKQHDLTPVLLYGLTVAGLPIRWLTFSPLDRPKGFRNVLCEAWLNGDGLRGKPDILKVNRNLAKSCPELSNSLSKIGIQLEIAGPSEKTLSASLRVAQNSAKGLWPTNRSQDHSISSGVDALCLDARSDHVQSSSSGFENHSQSSAEKAKSANWFSLPILALDHLPAEELSWKQGPWLISWEASVAKDTARHFKFSAIEQRTWLHSGAPSHHDIDDDGYEVDFSYDNLGEIAKPVINNWPYTPSEIAKIIGCAAKDLNWFVNGKTQLPLAVRHNLERLIGAEFDASFGRFELRGPCVLVAKKAKSLEECYNELTGGGDAEVWEIVPDKDMADPSWRYIILCRYQCQPSIIMAPRGEKITDGLPQLLVNYSGLKPVSAEFYRDVVSTCARACRAPEANVSEMSKFSKRYYSDWITDGWS